MFEELEDRFRDVLDRLRGEPEPATPAQDGRIIRQVMEPAFLKAQLAAIRQQAAARTDGSQLSAALYEEAEKELAQAAADPARPLMAHTPTVSHLQSILTTCIESRVSRLLEDAPEGLQRLAHAVLADVEIFREFGPCDPLWMETKLAEGWQMLAGRASFPDAPAPPVALAADARVILVGDWGTGLPGAAAVGEQIGRRIELARGRQQHLIHLGDVYYSGWREEYETRFLPFWPVRREEQDVLCWALNGNHDMYSGGHGYFGYLLHDPRFRGHWLGAPAERVPSSFFSLENDEWQILGLDSAYADHDLAGSQEGWLTTKLAGGRRTMLLTHHQPFSAYESVSQAMTGKVTRALGERTLDVWIWGHEHRCSVYEAAVPWLRFGSCVGNGGVPELLPDPVPAPGDRPPQGYAPLSWAYHAAEPADEDRWLRFGFAVLDFDGAEVAIEYVDEHGDAYHRAALAGR